MLIVMLYLIMGYMRHCILGWRVQSQAKGEAWLMGKANTAWSSSGWCGRATRYLWWSRESLWGKWHMQTDDKTTGQFGLFGDYPSWRARVLSLLGRNRTKLGIKPKPSLTEKERGQLLGFLSAWKGHFWALINTWFEKEPYGVYEAVANVVLGALQEALKLAVVMSCHHSH